ncbi:MAG: uroporphyrinogen decarboxylase family protein [Oscillospiraceae bacterium]|nr:uroporphyrinogen decarboxylase family protein [Oscillospiraceae bacterium]
MNMRNWLTEKMNEDKRKALPILSFPSIQLSGITVRDLISASDVQADGMFKIAQRCPTAASVSMMDLSVEAECFGSTIRVSDDEVPTVVGAVITDPEDADKLKVPAVGSGRTGIYIDAISKALQLITDRPVFAGVIGPFSLAGRLMDMTEIMIYCYDEPEAVHTVLQKATDFLLAYIKAYKDIGTHGVVIAEPAAGLLSPALSEEFSAPYIRQITDALQDDDFIIIYHNCGDAAGRMIPEILQTGCAAYHFGNAMDMEKVLAQMPEDVLTMGNIDPVSVLRHGDPAKVREATLSLLEKCSKHKNFLISSGCDIPPATPWENIDAFFAAVEEFYNR